MTASAITEAQPRAHVIAAKMVELVVTLLGVALVITAIAANQRYLDRHFLPSFLLPRDWFVQIEAFGRLVVATIGVTLVTVIRPLASRFVSRTPALAVNIAIAATLAIVAGEVVLGRLDLRPAEWLFADQEPRRQAEPTLGWTLVPARTGHVAIGGRTIDYAVDANGYRARRADEPVDLVRPTILFTGESVMFGEGLTWEETIPARVGAMLGVQSANLAVHGYGSDQAYLRLRAELPRFRRPIAVVSLFMTTLFGRNLNDDRPHLGPELVWAPGKLRSRLNAIAQLIVPYRSEAAVERGIIVTREVLRATATVARTRGATALVVVPQFGPEAQMETTLRRRILDEGGVEYVFVQIDPAWRLRWDRHPDARAAQAIAAAVATRLEAVTRGS